MIFNAVEHRRRARSAVAEEHELKSVEAEGRVEVGVVLVDEGYRVVAVEAGNHRRVRHEVGHLALIEGP